MAKITLNDYLSGFQTADAQNANMALIEAEFQNKVLYRDNPASEPNTMQQELNMGGNQILNVQDAVNAQDVPSWQQVQNKINASSTGLIASKKEIQTATAGQITFTLTTMDYTPGIDNLDVYINGVRQYVIENFVETSGTVVTFTEGLNVGDRVLFVSNTSTQNIESSASNVQFSYEDGTAMNVQEALRAFDVSTIAILRTMNGAVYQRANVLGYYDEGDGGGGEFYWDATSTETDNGGTIIQATGIVTGRWKRPDKGYSNILEFGMSQTLSATENDPFLANAILAHEKVVVPKGSFKVSTFSPNNGTTIIGYSREPVSGSELLIDNPGGVFWSATNQRSRVRFENISIRGNSFTETFLLLSGSGAVRYLSFETCNIEGFYKVWDAVTNAPLVNASYWCSLNNCRVRENWRGFYWEDMDECSMAATTLHNSDAYFEINYISETAPFVVGGTLTGGTSSETATIVGVIDNGTSGILLVSKPDGTNVTPLTILFQDSEIITGSTGGSATIDTNGVVMSAGLYLEATGGASFTGVNANNVMLHFKDCEHVEWNGGYIENYSEPQYQPMVKMENTEGMFNWHLLPGGECSIDNDSYEKSYGLLQPNSRFNQQTPILKDWTERFPNPSMSTDSALNAFTNSNMTAALSANGVTLTSTTAVSSYSSVEVGTTDAYGISMLVEVEVKLGTVQIFGRDTANNTGKELTSADGITVIRLCSLGSGSAIPKMQFKCFALEGGNFEIEIRKLNLTDAYGILSYHKPYSTGYGYLNIGGDYVDSGGKAFSSYTGETASLAAGANEVILSNTGFGEVFIATACDSAGALNYHSAALVESHGTTGLNITNLSTGSNISFVKTGTQDLSVQNDDVVANTIRWRLLKISDINNS